MKAFERNERRHPSRGFDELSRLRRKDIDERGRYSDMHFFYINAK